LSYASCLFSRFFFSSRRLHTRFSRDWSSDVCSSDLRPREFAVALPLCVLAVVLGILPGTMFRYMDATVERQVHDLSAWTENVKLPKLRAAAQNAPAADEADVAVLPAAAAAAPAADALPHPPQPCEPGRRMFVWLMNHLTSDTLASLPGIGVELVLCATILVILLARIPDATVRFDSTWLAIAGTSVALWVLSPWAPYDLSPRGTGTASL